jgi:hypothetical protein
MEFLFFAVEICTIGDLDVREPGANPVGLATESLKPESDV